MCPFFSSLLHENKLIDTSHNVYAQVKFLKIIEVALAAIYQYNHCLSPPKVVKLIPAPGVLDLFSQNLP
jgi:hypothetical protein